MKGSLFLDYHRYFPFFLSTFFWKVPYLILYKTIEKRSDWTTIYPFCNMKSKDLQKLVLSKYENGNGITNIIQDLNGAINLSTIERWCRRIYEVGTIDLVNSRGCSGTIWTKAAIQKIKRSLNRRKSLSFRKFARELGISQISVQRMLKNDLELPAYKMQKEKRMKFANWIRTSFRKKNTMNILFSDEENVWHSWNADYNSQNDRTWAINRSVKEISKDVVFESCLC